MVNNCQQIFIAYNMASIFNENTQYDMVQLPSKGECYRNKIHQLPVAYLTASDENIITSPKLLANGTMCDVLLEKKILDKTFNVNDLCIADREAILLWLRRTGYGDIFSYIDENGKEKEIDLSKITFNDFNQKGDEQGYFEITTPNGDIVKYRLLTRKDETEITRRVTELNNNIMSGNVLSMVEYYNKVVYQLLIHHIVSVNGNGKIDEWLNGFEYKDFKSFMEELLKILPVTNVKELGSLELNESLFYVLK